MSTAESATPPPEGYLQDDVISHDDDPPRSPRVARFERVCDFRGSRPHPLSPPPSLLSTQCPHAKPARAGRTSETHMHRQWQARARTRYRGESVSVSGFFHDPLPLVLSCLRSAAICIYMCASIRDLKLQVAHGAQKRNHLRKTGTAEISRGRRIKTLSPS